MLYFTQWTNTKNKSLLVRLFARIFFYLKRTKIKKIIKTKKFCFHTIRSGPGYPCTLPSHRFQTFPQNTLSTSSIVNVWWWISVGVWIGIGIANDLWSWSWSGNRWWSSTNNGEQSCQNENKLENVHRKEHYCTVKPLS